MAPNAPEPPPVFFNFREFRQPPPAFFRPQTNGNSHPLVFNFIHTPLVINAPTVNRFPNAPHNQFPMQQPGFPPNRLPMMHFGVAQNRLQGPLPDQFSMQQSVFSLNRLPIMRYGIAPNQPRNLAPSQLPNMRPNQLQGPLPDQFPMQQPGFSVNRPLMMRHGIAANLPRNIAPTQRPNMRPNQLQGPLPDQFPMLQPGFPSNRPPMMRRGIAPNQPRNIASTQRPNMRPNQLQGLPPNHFQRPQNINEPVQQPRRSRRVQQRTMSAAESQARMILSSRASTVNMIRRAELIGCGYQWVEPCPHQWNKMGCRFRVQHACENTSDQSKKPAKTKQGQLISKKRMTCRIVDYD